jgi:hypothetical protein
MRMRNDSSLRIGHDTSDARVAYLCKRRKRYAGSSDQCESNR